MNTSIIVGKHLSLLLFSLAWLNYYFIHCDSERDSLYDSDLKQNEIIDSDYNTPIVTTTVQPPKPNYQDKSNPNRIRYFRIFIKLLEPYGSDFADWRSPTFNDYKMKISLAFDKVFGTSESISSKLTNILNTANASHSVAIVNLMLPGEYNVAAVKKALMAHLNTEKTLISLKAIPQDIYIREIDERAYKMCKQSSIPCKYTDGCYSPEHRCNRVNECSENDNSDEQDCPVIKTILPDGRRQYSYINMEVSWDEDSEQKLNVSVDSEVE